MRRIAYLGPAGTFTEDALSAALGGDREFEPLRTATVHEAILAVQDGDADRALVPFENSIEGSVRSTLDALALDAHGVTIVGEYDYPVSSSLICSPAASRSIRSRSSSPIRRRSPSALASCASELSRRRGASGRQHGRGGASIAGSERPWAALAAASAAELYGCVVLRENVADEKDNVTRFVWLAPAGTDASGEGDWKTSLVFSELGEDHPGALVDALLEFSGRAINLTRIESRPLRRGGLGRYMFFLDIEGAISEEAITEAVEGLRGKAESVRVLGSYPVRATL